MSYWVETRFKNGKEYRIWTVYLGSDESGRRIRRRVKSEAAAKRLEAKKIAKECWFAEFPETEEPLSERMYLGMTPSMKSAIIEKVMASRKPGETIHGAISAYIREAIVLHLARH